MRIIKNFLKRTPLYPYLLYLKFLIFERNSPLSPSATAYKKIFIRSIAEKTKIPVFIETGTYLGDTINVVKDLFDVIYSIELDTKLANRAKRIFKKYSKIHIIEGDSGKILPKLLREINKPILFWLDAHWSGGITAKGEVENPILNELKTVFNWWVPKSIVLIDDARLFKKEINNKWPDINEVKDLVLKYNKLFFIKNDVIIITDILQEEF